MTQTLELLVGRNFANRERDEDDMSPTAWDAHRKRAEVLREALQDEAWEVTDWGDTFDETRTHEDVAVQLSLLGTAAGAGALLFGGRVLWRTMEDLAVEHLKRLMVKLFPALERREITRAVVTLPGGQSIEWNVDFMEPGKLSVWVHSNVSIAPEDLKAEVAQQGS